MFRLLYNCPDKPIFSRYRASIVEVVLLRACFCVSHSCFCFFRPHTHTCKATLTYSYQHEDAEPCFSRSASVIIIIIIIIINNHHLFGLVSKYHVYQFLRHDEKYAPCLLARRDDFENSAADLVCGCLRSCYWYGDRSRAAK